MIGNVPFLLSGFPILLRDLTDFEIQQLLNINNSPFPTTQWIRLSVIDQDLTTNAFVQFGSMLIENIEGYLHTELFVRNIEEGNSYLILDSEQGESVVDLFKAGNRKWLISNFPTGDIFNIRKDGGISNSAFSITQENKVGIGTNSPKSLFEISGSFGKKIQIVNSASQTIGEANIISVLYTATGAVTLTLPSAANSFNTTDLIGREYIIKDSGLNAGTYSITINRSGSDAILDTTSVTSVTINTNGGVLKLQCVSATEWAVI